jgi:O-antigen/teichoic acid export membrane protein
MGWFAPEWMRLWLGAEYAARGTLVAQWLVAGVLVNSLAYLPFTLLQARGRADLAAKAHLAELPLYLAALAWLVPAHGIEGAALAWALRCAADAALLFLLAGRAVPHGR